MTDRRQSETEEPDGLSAMILYAKAGDREALLDVVRRLVDSDVPMSQELAVYREWFTLWNRNLNLWDFIADDDCECEDDSEDQDFSCPDDPIDGGPG